MLRLSRALQRGQNSRTAAWLGPNPVPHRLHLTIGELLLSGARWSARAALGPMDRQFLSNEPTGLTSGPTRPRRQEGADGSSTSSFLRNRESQRNARRLAPGRSAPYIEEMQAEETSSG